MSKNPGIFAFFWLFCCVHASGQDVRAASYELIVQSELQYLNRLRLYVDTDLDIGRDSLLVFSGVTWQWLPLVGTEPVLGGDVTLHTFERSISYWGPSLYGLQSEAQNRISGILNMSNSLDIPLRLEPWFIINGALLNSTPVVQGLQTNIIPTSTGVLFAPVYTDLDGDSLAFSLVDCFGDNYFIPSGTTIDPTTGAISSEPPEPGLYAFCTRIEEYRGGVVIGTTYTDAVVQIDQVARIDSYERPGPAGLFPSTVSTDENTIVHCAELSELTLFDGTGRLFYHVRVSNGAVIHGASLSPGCYGYSLVGIGNGRRAGGRLIVY